MIGISLDIPEVAARGGLRIPTWLPLINGTTPTIFADFTTEGAANNYWANAAQQTGLATWKTAIGGTFSRASTATYLKSGVVNTALSGVARFPTDINGNPTGLRLTGAGTNFQLQSQSFTNAEYTKQDASDTITDNVGTAPDGSATASTFLQSATTGTHNFFGSQNVLTNASSYTYSVFAKKNAGSPILQIFPSLLTGGNCAGNFDLTNGTATSIAGTGSGVASIFPLANGWFLCSLTYVSQSTGGRMFIGVVNSTASVVNASEAGDGVRSALIWGAQTTNSAFQLDYIPTTVASATQAADSFSFPFAQTAFTALAGANGINILAGGPVNAIIFGDNASGNAYLYANEASVEFSTFNNSTQLFGPLVSGTFLTSHKSAIAGNNSGRAITSDGLTPNTDAGALVSAAAANASLGSFNAGTQPLNGNVSMFAVWNGLVASNANLQSLTS